MGTSWAEEELESKSKVISQIIGRPQHPKSKVIYFKNMFFFQTPEAFFSQKGVFAAKVMKGNVTAFMKNENAETNNVRDKHPLHDF